MTNLYIDGCENCTAHAGALKAYEEAKVATNDWEIVKIYINSTVRSFLFLDAAELIDGNRDTNGRLRDTGSGGMVAQVASLDLGWRGLSHWTHNHGSPRVFNKAAADLFNSLYQGCVPLDRWAEGRADAVGIAARRVSERSPTRTRSLRRFRRATTTPLLSKACISMAPT